MTSLVTSSSDNGETNTCRGRTRSRRQGRPASLSLAFLAFQAGPSSDLAPRFFLHLKNTRAASSTRTLDFRRAPVPTL